MQNEGINVVVVCERNLDIVVAGQVLIQLREAIEAGSEVSIDASAVERVDTACLQVLCAFSRQAKINGIALDWRSVSPSFRASADLLGLAGPLGLNA